MFLVMKKRLSLLIVMTLVWGCDSSETSEPTDTGSVDGGSEDSMGAVDTGAEDGGSDTSTEDTAVTVDRSPLGTSAGRPAQVFLPGSFDPGEPTPLIVLLHGFGGSGTVQDFYFGLSGQRFRNNFILVLPDGTENAAGQRFWNATDACCDVQGSGVDDVAYLWGLVEEARTRYAIDPARIFFMGHSNGGFMSYRMACEHGDEIAAIASLAGAAFAEPTDCAEVGAVSVLQIHGTQDQTILYEGGVLGFTNRPYPGAEESVGRWVTRNGCSPDLVPGDAALDYDIVVAGPETTTQTWTGCEGGREVELWTMTGSGHIPSITTAVTPAILDFLLSHPRP